MTKVFLRLVLGGIVGKVLGGVREVILAAAFGAGQVVAANRVGQTATLIPVQFFTADALSAGFLPLYVQYRQDRPEMGLALYRGVRSLLAAVSMTLTVALFFGSDVWVGVLAPGLDEGTARIAAAMLAIAALGVPFYVQFNLYSLIGLANDDVRLINLRASFQSIGLIAATIAAYFTGHVTLLAWGFAAPYVLLCGLGAWWVRRRGYLGHAAADVEVDRTVYRVGLGMFWRRLRPLLLIPVILQGSIAVERVVGSLLGVEVVAATEYARAVVDSLMVLLAAPLGLAGLAAFAKMRSDEVTAGIRRLVPPVLLLTVPLSLVACINSTGIVALLYGRGRFDDHAVATCSMLLFGFALGIWAQVLSYTFVKVLNARGSNRRAAIVMAASCSAAAAVNLLAYRQWGAFTIGVAASVGGLVALVLSALALGVFRFSMGMLAMLAPGAVLAATAGYLISGPGLARLAISTLAILTVWSAYVAMTPRLRHPLRSMLSSSLSRRGKNSPTDPGKPAANELESVS